MARVDGSNLPTGTKPGSVANPKKDLRQQIEMMIPELQRAMPSIGITPERMARLALTALNSNTKLYDCDGTSFLAALVQSAQLGLEPNTPMGQAYLIPYGKQVQFQVGYLGILELAYRSGQYTTIYAKEVYANDTFEYEYGIDIKLKHIPAKVPDGEPIYYYAVYKLKNGGYGIEVMSKEQVTIHSQAFSQAVQKGWTSPWKTNFDAMAKKTVLKKLLKYAPKSVELAKATSFDETTGRFTEKMDDIIPEYTVNQVEEKLDKDTGEIIEIKNENITPVDNTDNTDKTAETLFGNK